MPNLDIRSDSLPADSRKVRFSNNSTNELESEFAIEIIDDKHMLDLLELFPEKEVEILYLLLLKLEN